MVPRQAHEGFLGQAGEGMGQGTPITVDTRVCYPLLRMVIPLISISPDTRSPSVASHYSRRHSITPNEESNRMLHYWTCMIIFHDAVCGLSSADSGLHTRINFS